VVKDVAAVEDVIASHKKANDFICPLETAPPTGAKPHLAVVNSQDTPAAVAFSDDLII